MHGMSRVHQTNPEVNSQAPIPAPDAVYTASVQSSDLLEQIHRRAGSRGHGGTCERKHERKAWAVPLEIAVIESGIERRLKVITHDVSLGGFAFVADSYIHIGVVVAACFTDLRDKPTMSGIVRSCEHLQGVKHRVGVEFAARHRA
ncbi:MAG: PilZ domain-containing protein [Phycisphaerales bacterium]